MATFGLSIEKTVSFRGVNQVFANVYHYSDAGGSPSDADLTTLLDNIVAHEKTWHALAVTFVRGRVWSAGGSEAANQMRVDKALTGTGADTNHASMDRERALLVRWRAGSDSRGRPVYLRKWYHVNTDSIGGIAVSSGVLQNTAQLTAPQRAQVVTEVDNVTSETAGGTVFTLCGPTGRVITGSTECHPYLEHHQLGDMWRSV